MSIIELNEPPPRFSVSKFAKLSSRLNWIRDQDNEINSVSLFPIIKISWGLPSNYRWKQKSILQHNTVGCLTLLTLNESTTKNWTEKLNGKTETLHLWNRHTLCSPRRAEHYWGSQTPHERRTIAPPHCCCSAVSSNGSAGKRSATTALNSSFFLDYDERQDFDSESSFFQLMLRFFVFPMHFQRF